MPAKCCYELRSRNHHALESCVRLTGNVLHGKFVANRLIRDMRQNTDTLRVCVGDAPDSRLSAPTRVVTYIEESIIHVNFVLYVYLWRFAVSCMSHCLRWSQKERESKSKLLCWHSINVWVNKVCICSDRCAESQHMSLYTLLISIHYPNAQTPNQKQSPPP